MHLQSMMVQLGVNKYQNQGSRVLYNCLKNPANKRNPANRWKKWCQRDCKCQVSAGQDEADARYHIFTLD